MDGPLRCVSSVSAVEELSATRGKTLEYVFILHCLLQPQKVRAKVGFDGGAKHGIIFHVLHQTSPRSIDRRGAGPPGSVQHNRHCLRLDIQVFDLPKEEANVAELV